MEAIKSKRRSRGVLKGKITLAFQMLNTGDAVGQHHTVSKIRDNLSKIQVMDDEIEELFLKLDDSVDEKGEFGKEFAEELSTALLYYTDVSTKLTPYSPNASDSKGDSSIPVAFDLKLPHLECDSFAGDEKDSLKFAEFLNKFKNLIGNRGVLSNSVKLTYLKSYLRGYASKVVDHLPICDANYEEALEILEAEFLNKDEIVNTLFKKLLETHVKPDKTYRTTKLFLNDMRSILHDLKSHDRDLLSHAPSAEFVGHLIFNKLPDAFRLELARKLDSNYPSYKNIMDHYVDVINTLKLNPVRSETRDRKDSRFVVNYSASQNEPQNESKKPEPKSSNFSKCKLCSLNNHRMISCFKYSTHDARVKRCRELKLCEHCTSSKHDSGSCSRNLDFDCLVCKEKSHVSALCKKFDNSAYDKKKKLGVHLCLNSTSDNSLSTHLLPTMNVRVGRGTKTALVRCLIDTGSQRSYISGTILSQLDCEPSDNAVTCNVQSFLDSGSRTFSEYSFSLDLLDGQAPFNMPILVDDKFNLTYDVEFLPQAVENIEIAHQLADNTLGENSTFISVNGILGTDVLQYFPKLELVKCLQGQAFRVNSGIIPFGSIELFLTPDQNRANYAQLNVDSSMNQLVNFVMNPVPSYSDSIGDILSDSNVESNLEKFFSVDSLGIKDDENSISDTELVSKFREGIVCEDGRYFVDLIWNHDVLSKVENNFNLSKAVLRRVVRKLHENGIYYEYDKVFKQQLQDGVLEEIPLEDIDSKTFIPHRPVIKTDQQCTTKVRPVLNCSVKAKGSPSLNDAAYPGVNLLQNLFDMLLRIRLNSFIITSDIKQAFLQVKLKSDFDRNRFCILWYNSEGKLVCYRYTSLVFGFVMSPFVLNYLILHHVENFESDFVNEALKTNFYMDNLFFTSDDPDQLLEFYGTSKARMLKGGFLLRTWQSNSQVVKEVLVDEGEQVEHDLDFEKLLGYKYFPQSDELSIGQVDHANLTTKREVLSFTAKLYDPLGLYSVISNTGKIIMRDLWLKKLEWDESFDQGISKECSSFVASCTDMQNIKFDRCVGNNSCPDNELVIFTDASKLIYGFCAYVVSPFETENKSRLLFSKSKVAPIKTRSLPTLELMAIYLAFKCLYSLLSALTSLDFKKITLSSDSQVALSWVVDGRVKSKNNFADNRVKDISSIRNEISEKFGLKVNFEYINTKLNPADLLTRVLSSTAFENNLEFWKYGPEFLRTKNFVWPKSELMSISHENRAIMCNAVVSVPTSLPTEIEVLTEKFSSLYRLFRVVSHVLHFIAKLRKVKI